MTDIKQTPNHSEENVPEYILPDPLLCSDGTKITDARSWETKRRPEILELFRENIYGRTPEHATLKKKFIVKSFEKKALNEKASRKEISVEFHRDKKKHKMDILLYLPNRRKHPVPIFLGLNFWGNHSIHHDPSIKVSSRWMRAHGTGVVNNMATEESRGSNAKAWQVEEAIDRGYGVASIYCGDLEPDVPEGRRSGIRAFLDDTDKNAQNKNSEWGTIAAWSWGLSRAVDYFEQDEDVNEKKIIAIGHSRLGKTALWAAAQDERFAAAISNNSGCAGAALSKRCFGETVCMINTMFPHWFCDNFKKHNNKELDLPVDQHELIALMAPRPVYIASATKDLHADPRGEFLGAKHAEPVYKLFRKKGLGVSRMPAPNHPVGNFVCYHIRDGAHAMTAYDWKQYINFADRHFN